MICKSDKSIYYTENALLSKCLSFKYLMRPLPNSIIIN